MLGQRLAPGEFLPDGQGLARHREEVGRAVVPHVGEGQGGVVIGKQRPLLPGAGGQGGGHLLPAGAKGGFPGQQAAAGVLQQFWGPSHHSISSFRAARRFSGSVRHSVYSSKPGRPMDTSPLR